MHYTYHKELLKRIIEERDSEADEELNELFKEFYLKYRIFKYIDVLANNYSIQFDKSRKKHYRKNLLKLDQPISTEEESGTFIDFIQSNDMSTFNKVIEGSHSVAELIENEHLSLAFERLSEKQKKILNLSIINQWSNKEIADYFGNSPQNVSKLKRNAINFLRKELANQYVRRAEI
ncbi:MULTISPECIES: sigma-70 family RNA polymerase sigma factor [Allobacillus]|uniref:sigma-70 family RNA polymerase sigma factor n=1 Tax=Allobacillus TaxID=1400133 RepID=UPI0016431C0B|nr:sigma-70 family RNA polymerase sigma factor [Allobacillus salarius]